MPIAKRQKNVQDVSSEDDLNDELNDELNFSNTTARRKPSSKGLKHLNSICTESPSNKRPSTHGSAFVAADNAFFNQKTLEGFIQLSVNAANRKSVERIEELEALLDKRTQHETGLSNQLKAPWAHTRLQESHDACIIASDTKISALESARREDQEVLRRFQRREQEIPKLCQDLKSAKQAYVDAEEDIPRRIREILDEEVGPALADLKVLQDSSRVMQEDNKTLLNRVELLTSATTNIKSEMDNVVQRVDKFDTATTRDMKILQMRMDILENGRTQRRAESDDKVKRFRTFVDRDHETFTRTIKDSNDRYASLSARVDDVAADIPELKASMEAYTDLRFENVVAHTNSIAQQHLSAYARDVEATSKVFNEIQRSCTELESMCEAIP